MSDPPAPGALAADRVRRRQIGNAALAARAWIEFYTGHAGYPRNAPVRTVRVGPPAVLKPIDEAPVIGTNGSAQDGLAAIQCLALVGTYLPEE